MSDPVQSPALEERRLALEERKWDDEVRLRESEIKVKERESSWTTKLFSPLTATLLAGIATVIGSVVATLMQNSQSLTLERQKEQHELILKMIAPTEEQSKKNLEFLADVRLVDDETAKNIRNALAKVAPVNSAALGVTSSIPPPEELRRLMSDEAMELIVSFEVSSASFYASDYTHPNWPGGAAGLQIGIGYDLGYTTADDFEHDWKSHLSQGDFERLKGAVGIKGPAAQNLVGGFSNITITLQTAIAVFYESTLPKYAAMLDQNLPNTRDLPPESYGALVSLVYNRGPAFRVEGDRYSEMRAIAALMASKQFDQIPAQFRAMERLWPNSPALQQRREKEAALFQKGLGGGTR
jgi:hypothetical protein